MQLSRTLEALTQLLVRHLAIEDSRLYPPLLASSDPRIAALARSVFEDTGRLRNSFADFESRWRTSEAIAKDTASFLFELRSLVELVTQRVLSEDNLLCFASAFEDAANDQAGAA